MADPITKRKICVPYDGVCLQGGCGYCNHYGRWKTVAALQRETAGTAMEKDFQWGLGHDFANAEVKR